MPNFKDFQAILAGEWYNPKPHEYRYPICGSKISNGLLVDYYYIDGLDFETKIYPSCILLINGKKANKKRHKYIIQKIVNRHLLKEKIKEL